MRQTNPSLAASGRKLAPIACLCLGMSMIFWAVAAAAVERVISGHQPTLLTIVLNSLVVLVALIFIGLNLLIRREVRWALPTAFGLSLSLFLISVGAAYLLRTYIANTYLIIMTLATVCATWLALGGNSAPQNQARPRRLA